MIRLADVASLISGQHVLAASVNTEGRGLPYLTGPSDFVGDKPHASSWTTEGTTFAESGDILVTVKGSGCGTMAIADRRYAISRQLMAVRPTRCEGRFLWVALLQHVTQLRSQSAGTIPGLSRDQLLSLLLPRLDEHSQKTVSDLDVKYARHLTKLNELVERKRELKRGLMQELLTGRLRLVKNGQRPWHRSRLDQLLNRIAEPVQWDDSATYRLASIRRRNGGLFVRETKQGFDIKTKSLFSIRSGDFVISRMQAVHGALTVVPPAFDGYHVSGMYLVLRLKQPERIRTHFLHYASHLRQMYRNVLLSCHGVHIEKMTFDPKKFMKKEILLPSSLEEQDQIIAVLQALDREIALLEQQRNLYESQKRGLMHRLLLAK